MQRRIRLGAGLLFLFVTIACRISVPLELPLPSAGRATPTAGVSVGQNQFGDIEPFKGTLLPSNVGDLERLGMASYYEIEFEIGEGLDSLEGEMRVRYSNQETVSLDTICFWLYPNLLGGELLVSDVQLDGSIVSPEQDDTGSVLQIALDPALAPGDSVVASLSFSVQVPTQVGRNYGVFALEEGILALAHFYPLIPAYDEDGWNVEIPSPFGDLVYADVSFFKVTVDAPDDLVLVGSGELVELERTGNRQRSSFVAGPMRDFYLAASRDFEVNSINVGDTQINSYAPDAFVDASQRVLSYAAQATSVFNAMLPDYPYLEMDLVSTATQALGVEYPGVMAIAVRMYDPERMEYPEGYLESTVVHEVAHQWSYGLVGNDQQDEPWLDEALAQYLTLVYYREAYGENAAGGFRSSFVDRWDRVDRADIPIGRPVESYPGPQYGAIIYGRAPLFIEQLAEMMGPEDFFAFLDSYYSLYAWENVDTTDFRQLAETSCGCDLEALFEEWVYTAESQ